MKKIIFGIIILTLLNGCGLGFNMVKKTAMQNATYDDYGSKPPKNHREIEKDYIRSFLKDPYSAKFHFNEHSDYSKMDALPKNYFSSEPVLVWRTIIQCNAKNSYGGYTGYKLHYFWWKHGRMFMYKSPDETEIPVYFR